MNQNYQVSSWTGVPELAFLIAFAAAVCVYPACRVSKKAGFSAWWGLLFGLPPFHLVWIWYLATVEWPTGNSTTGSAGTGAVGLKEQ
jgi:hypothetical protein